MHPSGEYKHAYKAFCHSSQSRDGFQDIEIICSDTECICFADSAMIMHMVPERAEVSSCGLWNISCAAVQYI